MNTDRQLFILGNGFDLAHKLPTSYNDFKKYLKKICRKENIIMVVPPTNEGKDGGTFYDKEKVVGFIVALIDCVEGQDWGDLENTLGELPWEDALPDFPVHYDREGDPDLFKNTYVAEDISLALRIIGDVKEYLFDWINTILIDNAKPEPKPAFQKLINSNKDLFLTFNYTKTLEYTYGIQEVCHIHGRCDTDIIFGHGLDDDEIEKQRIHYEKYYTGAEDNIASIYYDLQKNVNDTLVSHSQFFNGLQSADIQKIFSIGFSFSNIDLIYIKEICKQINTKNVIWYLNSHNISKHADFQKKLKNCGFKGCFDSFSI